MTYDKDSEHRERAAGDKTAMAAEIVAQLAAYRAAGGKVEKVRKDETGDVRQAARNAAMSSKDSRQWRRKMPGSHASKRRTP